MNKYLKLLLCLIFDVLGYVSFIIPGVGEFTDVVWAPLSGFIMTKLFKGKTGKIAGVIAFVEEAFPFSDVIPTFTIMWVYTHLLKSESKIKKL